MAKPLTLNDLPEDLARFAEAQITAGRFSFARDRGSESKSTGGS
jgi:hypothetical protein